MRTDVKRIISFLLALVLVIGLLPAVSVSAADPVYLSKLATPATELLFEEDFDSYGKDEITLTAGKNEDYNLFLGNGSASIKNGRLYLSGSGYTNAYFLGGEMWGYYTVEADVAHAEGSKNWIGLSYYNQSAIKWQKGSIKVGGEAKLNGYDNTNGGTWCNDVTAVNATNIADVAANNLKIDEPFRLKIVANGKKASMYYARYDADGNPGEYTHVITIDNIPASSQSGGVGIVTGSGGAMWMDNLKVTRNLDVEESKHTLLSVNFDEYTGDKTATLAKGLNADYYNLNYTPGDKTGEASNVTLKNGRMYMTGNNYDTVYFDWKDAQHWVDYVVEADMCYTSETQTSGFSGLNYRVQSGTSAQKAGLYIDGMASLNGYTTRGGWVNDNNANGIKHKTASGAATVVKDVPYRIKVVVKGKTSDLYWAQYDSDGKLGEWKWLITINDIPDAHASGTIGFMTSDTGRGTPSFWVDNVEVYEYTNTYVEDFNSYGDVKLSLGTNNKTSVGVEYTNDRAPNPGTLEVKDGQLKFAAGDGNSSPDKQFEYVWFNAGHNWTNYTYEVDITFHNENQWSSLLTRVDDIHNWVRGGVQPPKRIYLGTYLKDNWLNAENQDKWAQAGIMSKNTTFRTKFVVEDNKAFLYYALYKDGVLQPYTFLKEIDSITKAQFDGTVGFLGCAKASFSIDNMVVSAGPAQVIPEDPVANLANIAIPETGIVNPPVIIQQVKTKANYEALATNGAAIALMDIDASMNILDSTGATIVTAKQFLTDYRATIIPAFRVDSDEEATALVKFLKDNDIIDGYAVVDSENASRLLTIRTECPMVGGILEYKTPLDTLAKRAASRRLANNNMASIVLVPEDTLSADICTEYSVRVVNIWSYASDKAGVYTAIADGYNGVVAPDASVVTNVYKSITTTTTSGIPISIGHRGRHQTKVPENTIEAFRSAYEDTGATAVELDLKMTADGYIVLMHDGTVDRSTNGTGSVSAFTLEELKKLDVETEGNPSYTDKVPTLEEVLAWASVNAPELVIYSHMGADTQMLKQFKELVTKYKMEDNVIAFARYSASCGYKNSDFGDGLSFIGGNSSGPYDPVTNTLAMDTKEHALESMVKVFRKYNHQSMPYEYDEVSESGTDDTFYYMMSARGFMGVHSTTNAEKTYDTYAITGAGIIGALTDFPEHASSYFTQIPVEDVTLNVKDVINTKLTVKSTLSESVMDCGIEWISGDPLTNTKNGYTMEEEGSAVIAYYADVSMERSYGTLSYRLYSEPITVTFQIPRPSSIAVKTRPNVTWYTQGYNGNMDLTGAQITVTYTDGSTKDVAVSSGMISGFDTAEMGTNTVTITYKEEDTTVTTTLDLSIVTDYVAESMKANQAAEVAQAAAETAKADAETAKADAITAKNAAEAAQAEALAAKNAADEAAANAGTNSEAAEKAAEAAKAAQDKADAAQAAAVVAETNAKAAEEKASAAEAAAATAQKAAEDAAAAAEESNLAAAKEAANAAEAASNAAVAAGNAAEEAATAAASAAASAESAHESAGYANDAAQAAKDAQIAQKEAEEAAAAAEAAQKAAEAAQKAAEEAALSGSKFQAILTLDSYAEKVDVSGYTREQIDALAQVVSDAKAAISEAADVAAVATALEEGKAAIDEAAKLAPDATVSTNVTRIYGENRFETSLQMADEMKRLLAVEKFDSIVLASGLDFADALSGSYLATQKKAPILLVNSKDKYFEESVATIADYIKGNLIDNGTVYILGGVNAIPAAMDEALSGYTVKRLAGANRYETNLAILAESGLGKQQLLISTGKSFADSVCASATGRPVLMVGKTLLDSQKEFLSSINNDMVILGGTAAVSEKVEAQLAEYGNVSRIGGANRFETSVLISENFFVNSTTAVLAYARTYPDALCSGPVAYLLNAPILLCQSGNTTANAAMTKPVQNALVIGGPKLINDDTTRLIFGLDSDYAITKQ